MNESLTIYWIHVALMAGCVFFLFYKMLSGWIAVSYLKKNSNRCTCGSKALGHAVIQREKMWYCVCGRCWSYTKMKKRVCDDN